MKDFKLMSWRATAMAAMLAGAVLAGCTDDDDKNEVPVDSTEGMTIKPRKIVAMRYGAHEEDGMTYYYNAMRYAYDVSGRVTEISSWDLNPETGEKEGKEKKTIVEYGANRVTVTEYDGDVTAFELENGCLVRFVDEGSTFSDVYEFSYSDGYLVGAVNRYREDSSDGGYYSYDEKMTNTLKDGNLTSIIYEWTETEGEETYNGKSETKVKVSNVENNMNLDLYEELFGMEYAYMLGVVGKRLKNLPESIEYFEDGELWERCEYSYETDEEGYVREIEEKSTVYEYCQIPYTRATVTEITYEE